MCDERNYCPTISHPRVLSCDQLLLFRGAIACGSEHRSEIDFALNKPFGETKSRAIREFACGDFLSPFDLHGVQPQARPFAARYIYFFRGRKNFAGSYARLSRTEYFGAAPEMARPPSERAVGAGPGCEAAHAVVNLLRGSRPVNSAIFLFENRGVGSILRVLRSRRNFSAIELQKRLGDEIRADRAHARGKFRSCFVRPEFHFAAQEHRARIHARINLHGGESRNRFAIRDGPVDRRGSPIARQQGRMQIEPTQTGNRQEACGDDLAVSDNYDGIGRDAFQKLLCGFRLDLFGLINVKSDFKGCFLHWRTADKLSAATRPVRLGDHRFDRNSRALRELPEGRHCEFRRATENDAQRSHRREGELPLAGLPQFADPAFDQVSLEHAEMLKEENPVEMVDLVAKGAGEQSFAAHFIHFALYILRAHGHIRRAQHIPSESGQREAAFFFALVSLGVNNFGIRKDQPGFGIFSDAHVNHGQAFR